MYLYICVRLSGQHCRFKLNVFADLWLYTKKDGILEVFFFFRTYQNHHFLNWCHFCFVFLCVKLQQLHTVFMVISTREFDWCGLRVKQKRKENALPTVLQYSFWSIFFCCVNFAHMRGALGLYDCQTKRENIF